MPKQLFRKVLLAALAAGAVAVFVPGARAASENILDQIRAGLASVEGTLTAVATDVVTIKDEVLHPDHGLAGIQAAVSAVQEKLERMDPSGTIVLSSGPIEQFDKAYDLNYVIMNGADTPQTVTVTEWNVSSDGRIADLGSYTHTIPPGGKVSTSVGARFYLGRGFGHFMELEVECHHPNVMATASLYEVVPPADPVVTRYVPAGDWVRLR